MSFTYVCPACGHFHPVDDRYEACEVCDEPLSAEFAEPAEPPGPDPDSLHDFDR